MGSKIILTNDLKKASIIIGLKKHVQHNKNLQVFAKQNRLPIFTVKQNSLYQIIRLIQFILL